MGRKRLPKTNVASTAGKTRTKSKPKAKAKSQTAKRLSTPDSLEPSPKNNEPEAEMKTENKLGYEP